VQQYATTFCYDPIVAIRNKLPVGTTLEPDGDLVVIRDAEGTMLGVAVPPFVPAVEAVAE